METSKLTISLPKQDLEFAERYARARQITVNMLVDQLLRSLRESEEKSADEVLDSADAWQELFRVGDALVSEDSPDSHSLTAAVVSMRR